MSNMGWIKLHRSKVDWEWFSDYKTSHLFEYILLCASHNEYKWKGKTYLAGQMPFGLHKASQQTGLTVRMIRTSLNKLKTTNELTIETSNQGSVITVVNWDKYQVPTSDKTNDRQASDKQTTTTNNVNNVKNDNNNKKSKFDLEKIYKAYPRKEGKAPGLKKLKTIIKTKDKYNLILEASKNYSKFVEATGSDKSFIKHFSTWVNQECWQDEYIIPKTQEELELEFFDQKLGGI